MGQTLDRAGRTDRRSREGDHRAAEAVRGAAEKVEHLFLASIAREPTKRELDLAVRMLSANGNEAAALQDIWWALLNSSEFILDH